jgi:hypothetical protein
MRRTLAGFERNEQEAPEFLTEDNKGNGVTAVSAEGVRDAGLIHLSRTTMSD